MKGERKKVCIIGAGASGLSAIKACLEEDLDVTCYDRSDYLGGLWRYRDADVDGLASVTKLTTINSSKEMSCYSDFPPEANAANFMHNTEMFRYFKSYAQMFDLEKDIQYNHYVEKLQPNDDYMKTGKWKCQVRSLRDDQMFERVFDAVMVCTGHHVKPHVPTFKGQDNFTGLVIHSHSLKDAFEFRDKRVVVVGIGNSGCDATVELANVARQVYLSTRRGAWVSRRCGKNGYPFDADFNRRFYNMFFKMLPLSISSTYMERMVNTFFDHKMYQLKPNYRFLNQHPCVNDFLPLYLLNGAVKLKTDISTFTQNGVIFEGEDEETLCDVVILATGYLTSFPFLDKSIIDPKNNRLELYKYMFLPKMAHPETLAFIGCVQSIGAIIPICEQQSRWVAQLLKGNCKLPNVDRMMQDIIEKQKELDKRFYHSQRHTLEVDFIDFMDEIASQFGAKPNLLKYAFTDPRLFYHMIVDPCTPYQYRLNGPHQWSGARKAILEVNKRIQAPFKTKAQLKI